MGTATDRTMKIILAVPEADAKTMLLTVWRGSVVGPRDPRFQLILAKTGKRPPRVSGFCPAHHRTTKAVATRIREIHGTPSLITRGGDDSTLRDRDLDPHREAALGLGDHQLRAGGHQCRPS